MRVPFADQGLNKIPEDVTDRQALLVGDVLATGFWAARISEITEEDTVLIIGAGPTGICTLLCVMLKRPKRIIVCEKDETRLRFIREHYPEITDEARYLRVRSLYHILITLDLTDDQTRMRFFRQYESLL